MFRFLKVPVVVSHLKCAGVANWGRSTEILDFFAARRQQQALSCDCYPYSASSSTLDLAQVTGDFDIFITWSEPEPTMAGRLLADIAADWGGLDVLCANAGIKGPTAAIEDMPLESWHQCLGVNLDGAMLAAKHGARLMKPAGQGVMIFTSSTSGLYGTPFRAPYVAAKWGVIGLMKTVAMELGPHGIRANAICPGSVNGPRIDRVIEAEAGTEPGGRRATLGSEV